MEGSVRDLPDTLRRHFWDHDFDKLTWAGSRRTVVLRILESGGVEDLRWLRSQMTDAEIRGVLVERNGRGISPRRLRFLGLVLEIPREQVDRWLASAMANPWNRRTG